MLIWVKLKNIPLVYWSIAGISVLSSFSGKPLYMDEVTKEATIMDFARVCVEVPLNSSYHHSFDVVLKFGEQSEIVVEYGWIPKRYVDCGFVGHNNYGCPYKGVK